MNGGTLTISDNHQVGGREGSLFLSPSFPLPSYPFSLWPSSLPARNSLYPFLFLFLLTEDTGCWPAIGDMDSYLLVLSVYVPRRSVPSPAIASRSWLAVAMVGPVGSVGTRVFSRWGFRMTDGPERIADGAEHPREENTSCSWSGRWFSTFAVRHCDYFFSFYRKCLFSPFLLP